MQLSTILALLLSTWSVVASQVPVIDGVPFGIPKHLSTRSLSHPASSSALGKRDNFTAGLRYVENSGVCETTPGVYQASGYADIAYNQSLFFWYFEARNDSANAPLSIWLNGGPGSSSMIGLFQELGPCRVTLDGSNYTLNPYAWNEYSNMIFLDSPVGVGFSYGTLEVGTATHAAQDVWTMLQTFLQDSKFSHLQGNEFGIWTESYGGHYGPAIAYEILQRNAMIDAGLSSGVKINLKALGVGNGITNPLAQFPYFLNYAENNPYNSPLVNSTVVDQATAALYGADGCLDRIGECYDDLIINGTPNYTICSSAQDICNGYVLGPLAGDYSLYDVRTKNMTYPPNITDLLMNPSLTSKIGIPDNVTWQMTNLDVYFNFAGTGDFVANYAPELEAVINSGIRTTLYAGDADYICNYKGFEAMAAQLNTKFGSIYGSQNFTNWTVEGHPAGMVKNAGTFSFVQVFEAGHEVPAYGNGPLEVGQAALEMFTQTMKGEPITNT